MKLVAILFAAIFVMPMVGGAHINCVYDIARGMPVAALGAEDLDMNVSQWNAYCLWLSTDGVPERSSIRGEYVCWNCTIDSIQRAYARGFPNLQVARVKINGNASDHCVIACHVTGYGHIRLPNGSWSINQPLLDPWLFVDVGNAKDCRVINDDLRSKGAKVTIYNKFGVYPVCWDGGWVDINWTPGSIIDTVNYI